MFVRLWLLRGVVGLGLDTCRPRVGGFAGRAFEYVVVHFGLRGVVCCKGFRGDLLQAWVSCWVGWIRNWRDFAVLVHRTVYL